MTGQEFVAVAALAQTANALLQTVAGLIPGWYESLKAKGENTPEVEAGYLAYQKWIYSQPWAQPAAPATIPTEVQPPPHTGGAIQPS